LNAGRLLQRRRRSQHRLLVEGAADDLQSERQAVCEAGRHGDAGKPAIEAGMVNMSLRYMVTGSSIFSRRPKAEGSARSRQQHVALLERFP